MANNPVMGTAICPFCKNNNPLIWNGNIRWICIHCNKKFYVKRQKLLNVVPIKYKSN